MLKLSLSNWPNFTNEEIKAVSNVLKSSKVNYWTGGLCRAFEDQFANYLGCKYGIALANGTLAIEIGLKALGIKRGDEVIVPSRSFVATASCVVNVGATPIFADVCEMSGNITANSIMSNITVKTKAIICVHLGGWPCDMQPIMKLARDNNIYVIEDCAQAHGAIYNGRKVGSFGDVSAWSFCQDKIMSLGGEGGFIATQKKDVWQAAWSLKEHGKSPQKLSKKTSKNCFRWVHDTFGTNARMTEMQAAIGIEQLKQLEGWVEIRNRNAVTLIKRLENDPITRQIIKFPKLCLNDLNAKDTKLKTNRNAYYRLYAHVEYGNEHKRIGITLRDKIIAKLGEVGIPCNQGACPEIYLEKCFRSIAPKPATRRKHAKKLGNKCIAFAVHPTLGRKEMDLYSTAVLKNIKEILVAERFTS